ncbi:hypothetical protein [Desulfonema ishimotonii]|nr:hypothetical protein [Desulfonema ishimotonii]
MVRREKIIVGLAMFAVLGYGGYYSVSSVKPDTERPDVKKDDAAEFINSIVKELIRGSLSASDRYIIRKSGHVWGEDPFENKPSAALAAAALSARAHIYSGFLSMNSKCIAVIDGAEYEAGEQIGESGPVLKRIFSTHVIIGMPGGKDHMIPLEGSE